MHPSKSRYEFTEPFRMCPFYLNKKLVQLWSHVKTVKDWQVVSVSSVDFIMAVSIVDLSVSFASISGRYTLVVACTKLCQLSLI